MNCSIWFQPDLPQPGVDLSKLKPKKTDSYPTEDLKNELEGGHFKDNFDEVISQNFGADYDTNIRSFADLRMQDQYEVWHYLPLYLCKVTNPDQTVVKFDEDGKVVRGVRMLGEAAHYVRCIPF